MYVHVDSINNKKFRKLISKCCNRLTKKTLVSLISAINSNSMGSKTVFEFSNNIKKLKIEFEKNKKNNTLYIDSGGYSIITGNVRFSSTKRAIECYNKFIVNEESSFDRIFSLDIPYWGNHQDSKHLSRLNLEKFNTISTEYLIDSISNNKQLAEKLHFVWHFKLKSQFDVWRNIFKSHGISSVTAKYAIGGLVGLRERFQTANGRILDFSPFTSMAVKCLAEHLSGPLCSQRFCLHFLGINHPVDRIQIALIDLVFGEFCGRYGYPKPELTYDTINYTISAMNNSRSLKICSYENGALTNYNSFVKVPSNIIKKVYVTDEEYEVYKNESQRFINNEKYNIIYFLSPLNVYSEKSKDAFFADSMKQLEIHSEILMQIDSNIFYDHVIRKINNLFLTLCNTISDIFKPSLTTNCVELFLGVRHLLNGDMSNIDARVEKTIGTLRLPDPFI